MRIPKVRIIRIAVLLGCAIVFCAAFSGCTENGNREPLSDVLPQQEVEILTDEIEVLPEKQEKNAEKPEEKILITDEPVEKNEEKDTGIAQQERPELQKSEEDAEFRCFLSVDCKNAILKNGGETLFLPADGVIFKEREVSFSEGESVFDVLLRELKENGIHLEFVNVPFYNSAYIEGIGNLYEFDCGELSGWMYKVNGIFPDYGASGYKLKDGDRIEWVYTCDLGKDVGGESSARNGMENE